MLKTYRLDEMDDATRHRLLNRGRADLAAVMDDVRRILDDVRERGDAAVIEYARRFDDQSLTPATLRLSADEIAAAYERVPTRVVEAIRREVDATRRFHQAQVEGAARLVPMGEGILAGWITRPIDVAGLYVPGGRACYPTVMQILAVPARVAGVERVVACTPLRDESAAVIVAADLAGVTDLYRIGGVQAIAAMAYGTETVPRVDKIVGPGSVYVTAAKLAVCGQVSIDMLAGPSEVVIIADEGANPAFIAADLLAQAEHDPHAACLLLTPSEPLARAVAADVRAQLATAARREVIEPALAGNSALIVTPHLDAAIAFSNDYAPEHLEIMTRQPWAVLERIRHAGSIFLGDYAPVAAGDYATGTNNTLPTSGWARTASGVSVDTFTKKSEFQYLTREGLASLAPVITTIAEVEGLLAHAESVRVRVDDEQGI